MKLICGITVAEEKGKVGKDGKVRNGYLARVLYANLRLLNANAYPEPGNLDL